MGMFDTAQTFVFPRAPTPPPVYRSPARTRAGWSDGQLVTDLTTKRTEWIAELEAIRDREDRAAFAALFSHFAPRVKAFLMRSGCPADIAEECVQDVMANVWRKAGMFDGTKASVATWIFTIARNRRIDIARRRRPEPEDLPWGPEAPAAAADVLVMQQESEKLSRALAELPDEQRRLVERAYFGELTHSEIAAETGLPLGTIKSRIRLALDRLRHSMNASPR